jgi:hypothetical protein
MTESRLYQDYIKGFLCKYNIYFYRMEHFKIPDIYCCKDNQITWIELKTIDKYRKNIIKPDWRPGQLSWIQEHTLLGGNNSDMFFLCLWYINDIYFLRPKEFYKSEELTHSDNIKYELIKRLS